MSLLASTISRRWPSLAGNRRLLLLCLLFFLLSAVLSFWAFFPAEVLQQRLIQEVSHQSGLKLTSSQPSLLFPLGIELNLKMYPPVEDVKPIAVQKLQVTPAWTTLFSKAPAIDLQGGLAGGNFAGQAARDGRLQLQFSNIAIDRLQSEALPYRATGQLQGRVSGEKLTSPRTAKGAFNLKLTAAKVLGLENFGLGESVSLGTLEVDGKFSQRRINLEKVVMTDGLLEMNGGGNLLVGDSPQKTRLNLNIRLHPTPSTPQTVRDLLSMSGVKPAADGSYLMRISGTLARPVLR